MVLIAAARIIQSMGAILAAMVLHGVLNLLPGVQGQQKSPRVYWGAALLQIWAQTVYAGGTYTPRPGDLALFALNGTSLTAKHLSHTAIVYDVESHEDTVKITVIDGNWGSTVKMRSCVAAISDGYMGKGYFAYFVAPKYE